ncbi:DUF423 domain-containing protein [Flavobacterium sp.]|uniref:DUF423 domain-containing protein n=1 Tax=Flavobacterium sp. TaxID=239 RepID=UPI00260C688B|nr:DUF423 domain-containing protein [Flavobacterium sp.]
MDRKILATGAFLGLVAIVLGAFGAHGLKKLIEPEAVATFETGVKYQMYHALFFLFLGSTAFATQKVKKYIFILVVTGVLLFSGSIYFLACNALFSFDFKTIGFITPIGGFLLIAAWAVLLLHLMKRKG